jgi:hypothetical protein
MRCGLHLRIFHTCHDIGARQCGRAANLASFLVDEVGKPAPVEEVKAAVKRLNGAQFIRSTEGGSFK